jgi:hypothetical protein
MAEIQAGTRFAAIAPSVDVERRSALVNTTALDYTIEDIAAAVGGDVDLSAYLTIANAATTYQPLSGMSSYLTTANAATTYQPLSGMSSYLTTANAATTYQPLSGMSSYLTTANAANTYQSKFVIGNTQQLFITNNVPDGAISNLGVSNVASGTTRGSFQIQANQSLDVGGIVYFGVNLDTVNGNARVIVSPRVSVFTQLITCSVSQIGTNFFQVLVKNIGTTNLANLDSVFVDFIVVR